MFGWSVLSDTKLAKEKKRGVKGQWAHSFELMGLLESKNSLLYRWNTWKSKINRNQRVKSLLHGDIVAPRVSLLNLHNFKKQGRRQGGRQGKGSWAFSSWFLFSLYIRSGWLQVNLRIHFITVRQNFATTLNIQAQIHKNVSPKRNKKTK